MRVKRYVIFNIAILGVLIVIYTFYIFLTSFSVHNNKGEITAFNKKYNCNFDITKYEYKDRYTNKNENYTLYGYEENYFLVCSQKSFWSFGRYEIKGGRYPSEPHNDLVEFEKYDKNGYIYILFGPPQKGTIDIKIANAVDSTEINKKYEPNNSYTFFTYFNKDNCQVTGVTY